MGFKDANELTPEQVAELKKKHGRLFKTTVCDKTYICRILYRPDWDSILELRTDNPKLTVDDVNEKIVTTCLIGPIPSMEDGGWAAEPAGVISTLSAVIRAKSGFIVPEAEGMVIEVEDLDKEAEVKKPTDPDMFAIKTNTRFSVKGVRFGSDYFVVRPLARVELRQIVSSPPAEQDKLTCEKAVIWPKGIDWEEKPAGYCETITELVMAISGFNGPSQVEDL